MNYGICTFHPEKNAVLRCYCCDNPVCVEDNHTVEVISDYPKLIQVCTNCADFLNNFSMPSDSLKSRITGTILNILTNYLVARNSTQDKERLETNQ